MVTDVYMLVQQKEGCLMLYYAHSSTAVLYSSKEEIPSLQFYRERLAWVINK